ncbi:MAG: NAD(P)/FAD-dependent oxidoreductase [Planctomycetaceae bacterium]
MRIAIIGAGISGLTAAYRLSQHHEITLFEANDYLGGHTHTVDVELGGERHVIDTGFIVFNDWTYPNFIALLDELRIASQPTSMSFSVRCDRTGLEYNGSSLNGLFAQRLNLFRPSFHRMIRDILRFNREGPELVLSRPADDPMTVGEFLTKHRYSREFADQYLLPMGAAIWSCPTGTFAEFPIRFIVEFYRNHGLLSVRHRPTWRVIVGGSRTYVAAMLPRFQDRVRLNTPIEIVRRSADGVDVTPRGQTAERFDHVIFACHSDQALRMLADPSPTERELLSAFPYERNSAVLHTDESLLPRRRLAWASWNYQIPAEPTAHATVSYCMNILQHIRSKHTFCVTLNSDDRIDPAKVLGQFEYHHPIFTTRRAAMQARHREVLNVNRTSFCGAYWGNGFHEDGVNSALAVCDALTGRPPM